MSGAAPPKSSQGVTHLHCRLCESACGLLAEREGGGPGAPIRFRPDPHHPVSRGYACPKGVHFGESLSRPDRWLHPHVDGVPATWTAALSRLGATLRRIRDAHGPDAIALYLGNAAGHSLGSILGATVLQRAIGTRRAYSCLTLDNAGQFVVLDSVFGSAMHTFTADYENSDCVVLFGTDPLASQPSQAQSNPRGVQTLMRHAQLIVVDPRQSATARHAALHIQPRPGGDVELLAFLLSAVLTATSSTRSDPATHLPCSHSPSLLALIPALAPFTFERACVATNLPDEVVDELVIRLLEAERPLVWSGLGVLLARDGTLGYWLTLCLQAALGGIDRQGGWLSNTGAIDLRGVTRLLGVHAVDTTNCSRLGHPATLGTLAAATLADDILDGRVRALVVVGGNPAVALPDGERAERALRSLQSLTVLDAFSNATSMHAHTTLPIALWPERFDSSVHMANQRPIPHIEWSEPAVPMPPEVREDWDILTALAAEMRPAARFSRLLTPRRLATLAMLLPAPTQRTRDATYAIPAFITALAQRETRTHDLCLVTSVRPMKALNSWIGGPSQAYMHPDDIHRFPALAARIVAKPDATLNLGVVVLPFGDGRANRLISLADLDPFTGAPASNGAAIDGGPIDGGPAPTACTS